MPVSAIALDFDPYFRIAGFVVRLETVALAVAILVSIALAGLLAGRTLAGSPERPGGHLRRDDLVFILLGIVPGAVIGGRLGYVLLYPEYYRANPALTIDPASGGLQLSLAILGGMLTGAYVASLFDAPVGRWLHAAALPLLVGLGLGKLAMALGGDGQGAPTDLPWATAYLGGWAWDSLGPAIPSHPAQLYEAAATGVVLVILASARFVGVLGRPDGRLFFAALGGWAIGRFLVAFTWRDEQVVGSLRMDQLFSLGLAAVCVIALLAVPVLARRSRGRPHGSGESDLSWPDPETRPRF